MRHKFMRAIRWGPPLAFLSLGFSLTVVSSFIPDRYASSQAPVQPVPIPVEDGQVKVPMWVISVIKPEVSLPIGMAIGGAIAWLARKAYETNQELGRVKFKEDVVFSLDKKLDEKLQPQLLRMEQLAKEHEEELERLKSRDLEFHANMLAMQSDIKFILTTREDFFRQLQYHPSVRGEIEVYRPQSHPSRKGSSES